MKKKPLTPKQLAAEMDCSKETILRALRRGDIKGSRIGKRGHWKVPADEADRLRSGQSF